MHKQPEPALAPPGAGLPKIELFIARRLFARYLRAGDRERFNGDFQREREKIRALTRSCTPESGATRVLIPRVRGIEDSSRFWSVWMTLDHLRIIHRMITGVIMSLAKGVVPPGKASTANVKPSPQATAAVVPEYEQSCDELLAVVAGIPDLKTPVRFVHPWFGPLDAAGWHAMAGTHLTIHRTQLERILDGLNRQTTPSG